MDLYKAYKKDDEYSYSLGAFPTFELIGNKPELVSEVFVHSTFPEREKLEQLCKKNNIRLIESDKQISKLSDKENCFVLGRFKKEEQPLSKNDKHLLFVNPSNMGNLGTILRTSLAYEYRNIAIIKPAADIFNPKTVRASMGALFHLNVCQYNSFEEYKKDFPDHELYCFMLTGNTQLCVNECSPSRLHTLVFGNEATGLPSEYANHGNAILIPQSKDVDSLNITIATGIACFTFTHILKCK